MGTAAAAHRFVAPGPVLADVGASGRPPTFSVITAAYNAETTIGDAMRSAFGQTVQPYEVIVVDDGSTDGTAAALAPWSERITLIRTVNRGVSAARNEAARAATGDFLAILDADDVFHPRRLEALGELGAHRPDLDILVTNVRYEQPRRRPRLFYTRRRPFPVDDQRLAIIKGCFPQHASIRRSTFEQLGGFDETLVVAEDWDLWLRAILGGSRAGLVDRPLIRYRQQPDGLTSNVERLVRANEAVHLRTLARTDLTDAERAAAQEGVERSRNLLALLATHDALEGQRRNARRQALATARSRAYPPSTRAKAAVAAILPTMSGRRLAERRTRSVGARQEDT